MRAVSPSETSSNPPKGAWRTFSLYLGTGLVTLLLTWLSLDLFAADFSRPFEYSGDALATAAHFKTVFETGWYEFQSLLGAPNGQSYHDFPTADNLHPFAALILSSFVSNWVVGFNLYYVLGFPLAALSALWFFRRFRMPAALALALSVAFAIAPYHFQRGEAHLWLASYYAVPLGAGFLVMVLAGKSIWGFGKSGNRVLRVVLSPTTRTMLFLTLLASSSTYYGLFFIVLMLISSIAKFVATREKRPTLEGIFSAIFTAFVMLLNMLPDFIFRLANGPNPSGLARSASEVEYYGIKLTQLLLPWPGHRVPFLSEIRNLYDSSYPLPGENPALGLLGALGLTISLIFSAFAIAGFLRGRSLKSFEQKAFFGISSLSFLIFVSLIFSLTGGLSTVASFFTSSLRGWNRMSIMILLFSLAVLGLCIEFVLRKLRRGKRPYPLIVLLVGALLLGTAYVDQTPPNSSVNQQTAAAAFEENQRWFDELSSLQPEDGVILQLPYVPFPESVSFSGTLGTEQIIPYLHSGTLAWSAGGIKGRPRSDFPAELEKYSAEDVALLSAASGFSGILIDRAANGPFASDLVDNLAGFLGSDPLTSDSGRYAFFDLQDLRGSIKQGFTPEYLSRIKSLVTNPVTPYLTAGFRVLTDPESGLQEFELVEDVGTFNLQNDAGAAIAGTLKLEGEGVSSSDMRVTLSGIDIGLADTKPSTVLAPMVVQPGKAILSLQYLKKPVIFSKIQFEPLLIGEFLAVARESIRIRAD